MMLKALIVIACTAALQVEHALDDGPSFSAYLVSYESDGLNLHAMVAVPKSEMPEDGYPVVIANHGYVPDPSMYGITSDGTNSRPGDYYRSVPELYASRGFLVVLPDYRGHNNSEGIEFTHQPEAVGLYSIDVTVLISHLNEIEEANLANVFMWSHSMGGGVSIRAQLATDVIRGASYWATMSVDDQISRFADLKAPIMIQHASGDTSTEHSNSERFATALIAVDHPVILHTYDSEDHFFEGMVRELAADRDIAFFSRLLR